MDTERLEGLIDSAPGPTHPELDDQARAWLATAEIDVEAGDGAPVTLLALAVDQEGRLKVYAVPDEHFDDQAHRELAAVNRATFETFFMSELLPEQFAGALRFNIGPALTADVFEDLVSEIEEEGEAPELDVETIRETLGRWTPFELKPGRTLPGPIVHVYAVRLCM